MQVTALNRGTCLGNEAACWKFVTRIFAAGLVVRAAHPGSVWGCGPSDVSPGFPMAGEKVGALGGRAGFQRSYLRVR